MGLFRRRKLADQPPAEPDSVDEERSSAQLFEALRESSPPAEPDSVDEERSSAQLFKALRESSAYQQWSTQSGVSVSLDSSLRNAAVWACVRVLTGQIAALPVDVYRSVGRGGRQSVPPPPIVRKPGGNVSRRGWVGQVIRSMLMDGNAYGLVHEVDSLGRPVQIDTLHPKQVSWFEGEPRVDGKAAALFPVGKLWHLPVSHLLMPGSHVALSPVRLAAESIGTAIAAEQYGAQFFAAGGPPTMLMKSSNLDLTEEQAGVAKDKLLHATKRRQPLVLDNSWDLKPVDHKPSETQFVDLLRFEVEQACRWFGVPPSMVFASISGANITYANVSQSDLFFLKYSVGLWVQDLEDAWSSMIAAPQFVKFNTDAILRMDKRARSEEHEIRLRTKTRTVNEVRELEDETPFDDPIYDQPGIPGEPTEPGPDSTDPPEPPDPTGGTP